MNTVFGKIFTNRKLRKLTGEIFKQRWDIEIESRTSWAIFTNFILFCTVKKLLQDECPLNRKTNTLRSFIIKENASLWFWSSFGARHEICESHTLRLLRPIYTEDEPEVTNRRNYLFVLLRREILGSAQELLFYHQQSTLRTCHT